MPRVICEIPTSCRSESSNIELGRLDRLENNTMFNQLYKNKQAFEIFLTIHVNFCCLSVRRPALRSKPLLDTMLWRTPASQKQYTKVDKGEDKKKYTIESTLKVSRYTFGHSDSTPSLSWHIESLRSSMSQSSLRENETFSRSEGIA